MTTQQQYKTTKKKKSWNTVQQAQLLSSNHRVVLPWCTQAVAFSELLVDNVTSQDFNFHPQCIILSKTCCGKNAEAAENSRISQLLSFFQRSVTQSSCMCSTPSRYNQGWSQLCGAWCAIFVF
jgi:hypothetical protein